VLRTVLNAAALWAHGMAGANAQVWELESDDAESARKNLRDDSASLGLDIKCGGVQIALESSC
jgi:hypothetical protein